MMNMCVSYLHYCTVSSTIVFEVYSGVHIKMDKPCFMKQMAYFWPSLVGNKNAIRLQPFRLHFSIDCSFKMRYCTKAEPERLGCDGIFISYLARPKIGHLLHKTGFAHSDMHTTVTNKSEMVTISPRKSEHVLDTINQN